MKWENFQQPIAEEIFADMHGANYFFKTDASNSFLVYKDI